MKTLMLLGSGELGKEVVIAAKRLGQRVIAIDNYANAPAMQVADDFAVIDMLDGAQLEKVVRKFKPDILIPEVESIRTEKLQKFEKMGITVVPTAEATHLTMNRDAIRDLASKRLKLKTAKYFYADSQASLVEACEKVGYPAVIKPIMSSSGKGQSIAKSKADLSNSWKYAQKGMRGDQAKVIVEEFISFDFEITLLTLRQKKGPTLFLPPIGHRQENGDYRESWIPAQMKDKQIEKAKKMAKKITDRLGGVGIFGVEFFVKGKEVYFSELSPRPHDTGMVTLISQDLSEFDLHVRAILGLPIPQINFFGPSASAVILAKRQKKTAPKYLGLEEALKNKNTDIRIFGKPVSRPNRRMGVALARGKNVKSAVRKAIKAASKITVQ